MRNSVVPPRSKVQWVVTHIDLRLNRSLRILKLFREDIVRNDETNEFGVVMRSWNDADDIPIPAQLQRDPLMRPLLRDEVGVLEFRTSIRHITLESEWTLVERFFHVGDTCKRSFEDVMSGIILSHNAQVKLRHAISDLPTKDEWIDEELLTFAADVGLGDFVVYADWLGQVEEIFEDFVGELPSGTDRVRFADLGGRHRIGQAPDKNGTSDHNHHEVIIEIIPLVICIAWLGLNQELPPHEAANRKRPPRFWDGPNLENLTIFRRSSERIPRVFERMVFKDDVTARMHGVNYTNHIGNVNDPVPIAVRTMVVAESRTTVKVLWQDGTIETLPAISLIPYPNIDDLDCWPGDFVTWRGDGEKRTAVVQSVNPIDRTTLVKWYPSPPPGDPTISLVSSLELDPHGSFEPDAHEAFGVQRGDIVFIHPPSRPNGSEIPKVTKIGELEPWVRDSQDVSWREEMIDIGTKVLEKRDYASMFAEAPYTPGSNSDPTIHWVGEVTHLRTSGEIEVRVPDGSIEVVTINRLTLLRDFADDFSDAMWNEDEYSDDEDNHMHGPLHVHAFSPFPGSEDVNMEEYESSETVRARSQGIHTHEDENAAWDHVDAAPFHRPPPTNAMDIDVSSSHLVHGSSSTQTEPGSSLILPRRQTIQSSVPLSDIDSAETPWQSFQILSSAPPDHAFILQPTGQPTRAFSQRLNKEYRVLSSSLPGNILVRAYEDRSDLLRSLIIGTQNTPYEDAPFVIDWLLPPGFPHDPPLAHFHSWTNGNGRVNPNLYEEGKVCLSILNTWAGDKSESWSSARSSLLQAFVSIQGLVLVREPYFCEPAFEKMRGTEEGSTNSRMYNEKTYVLARGFILHALQHPVTNFSEEIHWLYHTRGKLNKVLHDARTLIERSERNRAADELARPEDADRPVQRLTLGGILPLSRILTKLRAISDSRRQ